jgi:hypothetical protein
VRSPLLLSASPPPRSPKEERRWDGGHPYTAAEFFAHYGSRDAWNAAEPVAANDEDGSSYDNGGEAEERRYGGEWEVSPGKVSPRLSSGSRQSPGKTFTKVAYTKAEFFAFYGDYEAWDLADRAGGKGGKAGGARHRGRQAWGDAAAGSEASAHHVAAGSAGTRRDERRWDGGQCHTAAEFWAYYGDLVAWEAAEPAGVLHALLADDGAPLPPFAATASARPLVAGAEKPGERALNLRAFTEHSSFILLAQPEHSSFL